MGRTRSGAVYSVPRRRAYAAGVIANAGLRFLQRRRLQYIQRRKRTRGRYGTGVTNQFDRTNVYRKKRMPRFKRKRWVRFVKKVKAVENSTIGTRTRVFNNLLNYSDSTGPDGQLFKSVALYSNASATNNQDDLLKIMDEDPDIANSGKIQMISGIMDMTLVNRSLDGVGAGMGVELDVYMLTAKKRFEYKDAAGVMQSGNIEDVLADGNATAGIIGNNRIGITNRGATPFDFTTALSSFGVKVISKKKYFLPPGNQMTYQIRDPKNHQFLKDDVRNTEGQNKPGATKLLLIVAKGLPGAQAGANYSIYLNVGITRKYAYKINEDDEDMTGFKS